jgi:hypothetical protein
MISLAEIKKRLERDFYYWNDCHEDMYALIEEVERLRALELEKKVEKGPEQLSFNWGA